MTGIPWDEPVDGVLHSRGVAGAIATHPSPIVGEHDPNKPWVVLRFVGGEHDGQTHTMPASCSQWQCGHCHSLYF